MLWQSHHFIHLSQKAYKITGIFDHILKFQSSTNFTKVILTLSLVLEAKLIVFCRVLTENEMGNLSLFYDV